MANRLSLVASSVTTANKSLTLSKLLGKSEKVNNGNAAVYTAKNIGIGLAGIGEGVKDLLVSSAAQLSGDKAYAKYLYNKSTVGDWKKSLDESYNPGKVMSFVGDVGQGLGQSAAFLIPGAGAPLFFGGVIGQGIGGAVQTTGELGAKEYIYGALTGTAEGLLEKYVGAGGQLLGNITGKIGGSVTKKVVSALASKTAGQAVWKGVAKSMLTAGAGEFAEEFLGDYIDTFLLKATGVDENAEYSASRAAYSGLVGLVSGAAMGGVTKGINTQVMYNSGAKVFQNGNADTLIKQAKFVADGFQTKDTAKLPEALKALKESVAQYEASDKTSASATIKLGEVKAYLAMTEMYSGVQEVLSKLDSAADVSAYAKYMTDFTGKTYTVEDFKADKDKIKTNYASQAWATLFLKDSKAEIASKKFNDIIAADIEGKTVGKPVAKDITEEWNGEETVYSLDDGNYLNIMQGEDGYSISEGKNSDEVRGFTGKTLEQTKEILTKIRQATAEQRNVMAQNAAQSSVTDLGTLQGTMSNIGLNTLANEEQATDGVQQSLTASTANYTAQEQDSARKAVKNFDTLSPDSRSAIMEWVKSAKGVDKDVVSAVSFIMSVRPGLQVIYSQLGEGHKGLYANLTEINRRLIVTSGDAKAVRETIAHELSHDLSTSKGWESLKKAALEIVSDEEKGKIIELYTSTLGLSAEAAEEEVVAKTVGKMLSDKTFLERYAQKNKISRIAQTLKELAIFFKSKGADRIVLTESYKLMQMMDSIIKNDYVTTNKSSASNPDIRYDLDDDLSLVFDDDFYAQFVNESKAKITESIADLEKIKASESYEKMPYEESYDISAKLRALKLGYSSLYDMYVGIEKDRLTKDYKWSVESNRPTAVMDIIKKKKSKLEREEKLKADISSATPLQKAQFEIIQKNNPMFDDEHVGIRSPKEIKSFSEAIEDAESFVWGDFSKADAQKALRKGIVKVYSSYPIKNGTFVSTSYIQALQYAGDNAAKVNSKTVALDSVAWINGDEGQYAKVYGISSSANSAEQSDIRYDLDSKDIGTPKEIAYLKKQVIKYQASAEYWKKQTKVTDGVSIDQAAVTKKVKELIKKYNSKAKGTTAALKALYDYIANDGDKNGKMTYTEVHDRAVSIAEGILSESYEASPEYETYRGIRSYITNAKVKVSEEIKKDFPEWSEWRKRNMPFTISQNGVPVDVMYQELQDMYGEAYFPSNIEVPADQLRHISESMKVSKNKVQPTLFENIDQEAENLAGEILDDYFNMPKEKTLADKQAQKVDMLKSAMRVMVDIERVKKNLTKKKTSGVLANAEYEMLVKTAKTIKPSYELSPANARQYAQDFIKFIEKHATQAVNANVSEYALKAYSDAVANGENEVLKYISPEMHELLVKIAKGTGALNADEMNGLHIALSTMLAMDNRVDKIYYEGRWIDTKDYAKVAMSDVDEQYKGKPSKAITDEARSVIKFIVENSIDPEDAVRSVEGLLSKKTLSKGIHSIKLGLEKADAAYYQFIEESEQFIRDNKEFWKSYNEDTVDLTVTRVDFKGTQFKQEMTLTKGEAFQLYMTSKREQAKLSLAMGNVKIRDAQRNGEKYKARIIKEIDKKAYASLTDEQFEELSTKMFNNMLAAINQMEKEFTSEDKAFIRLMEGFYNGASKENKKKIDDILFGKTNVIDTYYVPIVRSEMGRDVNLIQPRIDTMTVGSYSFNKDTVQGARNQLIIGDAYSIFKQHAMQVAKYAHLTIPLQNLQRIYNFKFDEATADVRSVREYISTYVWKDFDNYLKTFYQDVQGTREKTDMVSKKLRAIKGNYAKFAIGANIGSLFKQFASSIMMMTEVDIDSWTKGGNILNKELVDKYSVLAANRNNPHAQYYAQGATGKLGKVGEAMMWHMKFGDRQACLTMWTMLQHDVEKKFGFAIDSEENLKKSGELLDDAILSIQDTGSAATKSGIARSPNELGSAFTMFRSASIKMLSKIYIASAETAEVVRRKKAGEEVSEEMIDKTKKRLTTVASAVTLAALFEATISVLLSKLRGRYDKEEEEKLVEKIVTESALNLIGLVPVAGQLIENWAGGYDTSLFYYDILNDGKNAINGVFKNGSKVISGEYVDTADVARSVRDLIYFLGTITGIPTRNVNNFATMVLRTVSVESAYKYGAVFTDTGMTATLNSAISKGNDKLAEAVISNLYSEKTGKVDATLSNIISELYSQGYNVLPTNVPTSYKVGEETKTVTAEEHKTMKGIYSQATEELRKIVVGEKFNSLEPEAKARAISLTYSAYLNKAKYETLGTEPSKVALLMGYTDIETLMISLGYISTLEGENKAEEVKEYIRKYDKNTQAIILYSAGYSTKDIRDTVKKIVNKDNKNVDSKILKLLGL